MALDPRTPVLVGVGQLTRMPKTPDGASEPVEMMAEVLRAAGKDSGTGDTLLRRADSVRVISMLSWRYANPGLLLAERVGGSPRETVLTSTGGNSPQTVVNDTALAIQRGDVDIALIAGAEAVYTRLLTRKVGYHLPWTTQPDGTPLPRFLDQEKPGTSDHEVERGLMLPTQIYPLFENALRAAAGESVDEHQRKITQLWGRFSEVAARNPHAWTPVARTAEEIADVGPDNRMIAFPYPKLLNANIQTDQAAALILCSAEAAEAAGVPKDRWVFPWSGADAQDHWYVSERDDLHSSPAIRLAGAGALEAAGLAVDDIAHLDLYSCFPAAVQIGAAELGLPLDDPKRPLTLTGGLGFAGGPGNNYVTHSIATLADTLRDDPGSNGLVTALGWYVTKHAIGVYGTDPPRGGRFEHRHPQDEVDALPKREPATSHEGDATVETSTVLYERDGSMTLGIVACLLPDGRRAWGNTRDADAMKLLTVEETAGRPARLAADGAVEIL